MLVAGTIRKILIPFRSRVPQPFSEIVGARILEIGQKLFLPYSGYKEYTSVEDFEFIVWKAFNSTANLG